MFTKWYGNISIHVNSEKPEKFLWEIWLWETAICGKYNDLWQIFQVQSLWLFISLMQLPLFLHLVQSSSNKPYLILGQILLLWNKLNNNSCTLIPVETQNITLFFKGGTSAVLHCSHYSFLQGMHSIYLGCHHCLVQAKPFHSSDSSLRFQTCSSS